MMELFWFWGGPPNPLRYERQESGFSVLVAELLRHLGQIISLFIRFPSSETEEKTMEN